VFVLQVEGSKQWTLYGTPVELPLSSQEFDVKLHPLGEPTMHFVLEPGDIAYIPRGVVHAAHSADLVSLHITAGVLRHTWRDLLLEIVARASLEDPAFRQAIPPGFAHSGFNRERAFQKMQILLQRAATKPNFEAALDLFVDESIASSPPLLTGQMTQLAAVPRLGVDDVVGVRTGVNYRLQADGDFVALDCHGRRVTFPRYTEDALRFALNHPRFVVRDLPGDLDDAGKLTLARRLIREGIILAFLSSPESVRDHHGARQGGASQA
jgi:hypothetical protein